MKNILQTSSQPQQQPIVSTPHDRRFAIPLRLRQIACGIGLAAVLAAGGAAPRLAANPSRVVTATTHYSGQAIADGTPSVVCGAVPTHC